MVIRNTKEEIDKYFEDEAMSQSKLKLLLTSVHLFNSDKDEKKRYYEEKGHFIIGNGVDDYISLGEDYFKDNYHPSDLDKKPGKGMLSIVHYVFDKRTDDDIIHQPDQVVYDAYKVDKYQPRWTDATRMHNFLEETPYWNWLLEADGKQILSKDEYDTVCTICHNFYNTGATCDYFSTRTSEDIFYQLYINFLYKDIPCKALLDMVIVDNWNKIIAPIDIKTLGDYVINFPISMKRRRYDIQGSWYYEALKSWRDEYYPGFKITQFEFLVESTKSMGNPRVFKMSHDLMKIGKYGRTPIEYKGIYIPEILGFDNLIDTYKWHLDNGFDIDKNISEKDEFIMDWNKTT